VARDHTRTRPLPGRDLSGLITGRDTAATLAAPIYFMTEDDVTHSVSQRNVLTGEPFESLQPPKRIESVVATLPTGENSAPELWKLNHYYERLDEWNAEHGIAAPSDAGPAAEPAWELHNLTTDPEERHNLSGEVTDVIRDMRATLEAQRDTKRLLPTPRA